MYMYLFVWEESLAARLFSLERRVAIKPCLYVGRINVSLGLIEQ